MTSLAISLMPHSGPVIGISSVDSHSIGVIVTNFLLFILFQLHAFAAGLGADVLLGHAQTHHMTTQRCHFSLAAVPPTCGP